MMRHSQLCSSLATTILALATSITLVLPLVAQSQPQPAPPAPLGQDTTVPYGQAPQDNLPPLSPAPQPNTAAAPPPAMIVPPSLTIPAGTFVTVRLMGSLSSDINQQGDGFSATLEQPVVVNGWVVARRGQIAVGHVVSVQKAGRVKGVSSLGVALSDLPLVDGRQLALNSQLIQTSAGTSRGRDAVGIASTTGLGAAIGGAVDGGTGAGIGAAAGAVIGVAGVLLTPGRPTVMLPETLLTFRLQEPVTIDTQHGLAAFLPVNPQDYADMAPPMQPRPVPRAYPSGPVYPYPYPAPYPYPVWPYWGGWGFYPSVAFVGYYGYGWGHPGHWH